MDQPQAHNNFANGASAPQASAGKQILKWMLFVLVLVALAVGGWQLYQKYGSSTVSLRKDLPPAPRGYDTINKDPNITKDLPQEFQDKYQKEFDENLIKLKEHPDSYLAWMDLGFIKQLFGDYKGAEDAWLYATELSPGQGRSLMNLGGLYLDKLQNFERAEWAYKTAIEREPITVPAYRDLAFLYRFNLSRKEEAYATLQKGVDANPTTGAELWAVGATWAEQDGNIDAAIQYYENYLAIQPSDAVEKDLERLRGLKR